MNDCSVCGWCETPERCVWSAVCPRCAAAPGVQCRTTSGKLEGLHEERWHAVGLDWRVVPQIVVFAVPANTETQETMISLEDWEELRRIEEGAVT